MTALHIVDLVSTVSCGCDGDVDSPAPDNAHAVSLALGALRTFPDRL